jgi:hypothetical protein
MILISGMTSFLVNSRPPSESLADGYDAELTWRQSLFLSRVRLDGIAVIRRTIMTVFEALLTFAFTQCSWTCDFCQLAVGEVDLVESRQQQGPPIRGDVGPVRPLFAQGSGRGLCYVRESSPSQWTAVD